MAVDVIKTRRVLRGLEHVTLTIEGIVNRLTDARYNPLYHTGTLAVWLLLIVGASGSILLLIYFAIFGLVPDVAFTSIERLNDFWPGQLMRSVHRFAADLAVIFILLHALRMFVTDRFAGSRWLAWISGVIMLGCVWLVGLLGFWLPGDTRAQWIGLTLGRVLGNPVAFTFLTNAEVQKAFYLFWLILILHIGLGGLVALLFWLHTLRLSRAKIFPPRFWVYGLTAAVVALAMVHPAILAPPADLSRLLVETPIDPFYLFLVPVVQSWGVPVFMGVTLLGGGLLILAPWLSRRRPERAEISPEGCSGCSLCAGDCPYSAIEMCSRGGDRPNKLLAVVNPSRCVACGVCVGACSPGAIQLPGLATPDLPEGLAAHRRVILACQRHLALGALRSLSPAETTIWSVPCAGAIHPAWVLQAQQAGAKEVVIVGCVAEDCSFREGNQWLAERLAGTRAPILSREVDGSRLRVMWVTPNDARGLQRALAPANPHPHVPKARPAQFLPGFALLTALLAGVVFTADVPFRPYPPDVGQLKVSLAAGGQFRAASATLSPQQMARLPQGVRPEDVLGSERFPIYIEMDLDGKPHLRKTYSPGGLRQDGMVYALEEILLPPGDHQIEIRLDDCGGACLRTVYRGVVPVKSGEVRVLTFDAQRQTFVLVSGRG